MSEVALLGKKETKELLERNGLVPNKQYGQNFLIDKNILHFIADAGELCEDDIVLEVGPGNANLTQLLADKAGCVIAAEIDRGLFTIARNQMASKKNTVLVHGDILNKKTGLNIVVWQLLTNTMQNYKNLKVIANLPYAITTPFLVNLLCEPVEWSRMVFTIQDDVAARMTAEPGCKEYGILSVILAMTAKVKVIKKVAAKSFWPAPRITSAIVRFDYNPNPRLEEGDLRTFGNLARVFLAYRRKTLNNALRLSNYPDASKEATIACLKKAGVDLTRRGETFSPEEILDCYCMLKENKLSDLFRALQTVETCNPAPKS